MKRQHIAMQLHSGRFELDMLELDFEGVAAPVAGDPPQMDKAAQATRTLRNHNLSISGNVGSHSGRHFEGVVGKPPQVLFDPSRY